MELEITSVVLGADVVVRVVGEVDAYTAPQLRERLLHVIAREGHHLVMDLSGVPFLDSSGINALVSIRRRVSLLGGSVRLAGLRPGPAKVLQVCGLERVFTIHASVDDAVTAGVPDGGPVTRLMGASGLGAMARRGVVPGPRPGQDTPPSVAEVS